MKKKRIRFASVALTMIMAMTMILGLCTNVTVNAEVTPNTIVDPETSGDWSTYAKQSTEYVGRIWTDKTVYNDSVTLSPSGTHVDKGDSDFLVNLSALSSTSSQTASTYQPLNIVLVLDQSGSMANRFGDDWNSPTKQSAMKTAVTNFIDQIYDASISSDDVYHKLGIVTYESDSSVLYGDGNWWSGYTLYNIEDENNYQNALNAVNGLSDSPSGATRTDLGMQAANGMLDVEEGRKNIVILFTDGVPTTSSSFKQ